MSSTDHIVFPPGVLARISPQIALERHLALGFRPSLRKNEEFRTLSANPGSFNSLGTNSLVGSATVKNGATHAFCGISLGIEEVAKVDELLASQDHVSRYASVYPVVEVARGRSGAPTDEEMILSQKLHDHVLQSHMLPLQSLDLIPGYQLTDENTAETYVAYPDNESMSDTSLSSLSSTINVSKKSYRYVLYAHIKVFSRVGPLFDLVHYALVAALKNVSLPRVYLVDSGIDPNIKVPVRSRGNFGHLGQASSRFCMDDSRSSARPLHLDVRNIGVSSSFGLVELSDGEANSTVLMADLEGEAEEACAETRITVVRNADVLKHVSIVGGGANVTLETLKKASLIARTRAAAIGHE